jgi:RIO-like serine/threonine protein kinase
MYVVIDWPIIYSVPDEDYSKNTKIDIYMYVVIDWPIIYSVPDEDYSKNTKIDIYVVILLVNQ